MPQPQTNFTRCPQPTNVKTTARIRTTAKAPYGPVTTKSNTSGIINLIHSFYILEVDLPLTGLTHISPAWLTAWPENHEPLFKIIF